VIIIDNYDSFTYNLVEYFRILGKNPKVYKNDEISIAELKRKRFSSIIISPGPGNPSDACVSNDIIKEFYKTKKILGVCLGHQVIAKAFGAKVCKGKEPVHGKVFPIKYKKGEKLFNKIEQNFLATRYHSLIVDKNSIKNKPLIPIAWTHDGNLMAIKHKKYPVYGVQFHPESILSKKGKVLLFNFLNML
jgi:anthranilate synthase/aminodeoxychorismate synthase-like glutamine amidotransferase